MTPRTEVEPRSKGLLTPSRIAPAAPVSIARHAAEGRAAAFVRHYWLPRWQLPDGTSIRQDVLEYPTANLVMEERSAALYRAHRGMSSRTLEGSGWAFGVLLHPGVSRGWAGISLRGLPPSVPLDRLPIGQGAAGTVAAVRERMADGDDASAIAAFEEWLGGIPEPDDDARLVDRIVAEVEQDRTLLRVEQLADRFGLGVRHLQRLVAGHIGFGPKWLIQRYRLQEAAAALRSSTPPSLADLAAELGYADQAHFSREFKSVIGSTPGAYTAAEGPE
ncbi:AraC-type DNA-binding protein [Leifsonia sp. 98AMF]|uniref:helix-turn-helix domain-containing protein n=1 Tax=unclassified Leifsonia TaxID=2663824 RepID=UPI000879E922|nr:MULTISPECIES: helix-turn-helix domain-containing protein [unclassified Leifsonia]SDH14642.1 AraC-type DNA-binding protein [Leifsonia sp. 197AMF]SDJ23788.1 AraC-type DNA-binding protein [Leifsonia sp. 466MF]SDK59615.1 AraC-type DNA-binding protein [Leifsonia sp. 157MF]SDN45399.1 AraC-type DNA-binding protein [Leifsonia sp. 509MF]SEN65502.1 AraC-type DNA-binding protein [Leifsonia sp. 467MF]